VEKVIARERRIVATWVADAVVDGIVPVVIVITVLSVPPTIMRLEGVMRPANAGVSARDDNSLAGESERPDLGSVRVIDARLDHLRLRRRLNCGQRLREEIPDLRIAFYPRHVREGRQCLSDRAVTLH
jgi:hypothetical protein